MKSVFSTKFPVLALRDIVPFPGMIVPLFVGREKSLQAINGAAQTGNKIILVAQRDAKNEELNVDDFYKVGVVANIIQVLNLQDNNLKVLVECKNVVRITKYIADEGYYQAKIAKFPFNSEIRDEELGVLRRAIMDEFEKYTQLNSKLNIETVSILNSIEDPLEFINTVAAQIFSKVGVKQEILEATDMLTKLERTLGALQLEIEFLNTETRIKTRVKSQIEKNHKDFYLNEQLKAIQKELGDEDSKEELNVIKEKIDKLQLSPEAREKCEAELKKLKLMNQMSSEATVIRSYLDWILSMPWSNFSPLNKDLKKGEKILDSQHFGLDKIKERIVEYLAVNLKTKSLKSPIICLVGPPGVGKTSLVKSIAEATGREFAKVALGGLRDEAEIKGHRRTYIGSMPGKILQAIKKTKRSNPVILLDEIDKMSFDFRGDPASAMLEVLDPEQNANFNDHYFEIDYDLSQVMFVATANSMDGIPRPLLDRMEIIRLSGYTEEEKVAIAKNHLIPRELKNHGLKKSELEIDDSVIVDIIRYYTREAGVRTLDKSIATIARKSVKKMMTDKVKKIHVSSDNLKDFLGVKKFSYGEIEENNLTGVTTGLAYSEVGGDILAIEALLLYGKGGEVKITGKLGDVMKESAQAALSYIRSRATDFGIKPNLFKNKDLHIHVPEGATPKDGPSAGIAMATSIVSILSGIPVRKDVAMTGEITLRGRVLAIGGLKEKLLAALRGGVKTVLIPKENVKDLEDLPDIVKNNLEIIPVQHVDEVFKVALTEKFQPIEWDEEKEARLEALLREQASDHIKH